MTKTLTIIEGNAYNPDLSPLYTSIGHIRHISYVTSLRDHRFFFPVSLADFGRITAVTMQAYEAGHKSFAPQKPETFKPNTLLKTAYVYEDGSYSEPMSHAEAMDDIGNVRIEIPENTTHLIVYVDGTYSIREDGYYQMPFYAFKSIEHTAENQLELVKTSLNASKGSRSFSGVNHSIYFYNFPVFTQISKEIKQNYSSFRFFPFFSSPPDVELNPRLYQSTGSGRVSKNGVIELGSGYVSIEDCLADGKPNTTDYAMTVEGSPFLLVMGTDETAEYYDTERFVSSKSSAVKSNVVKNVVISAQSYLASIASSASKNVLKESYSHVEPLLSAVRSYIEFQTSTKGNRISTIAFTRTKTASSSLVESIQTKSERTAIANLSVESYMQPIHSHAIEVNSVDYYATSQTASICGSLEVQKTATIILSSQIASIQSEILMTKKKEEMSTHSIGSIASQATRKASRIIRQDNAIKPIQTGAERILALKHVEPDSYIKPISGHNESIKKKFIEHASLIMPIQSKAQFNVSPVTNSAILLIQSKIIKEGVKSAISHLSQIDSVMIKEAQKIQLSHTEPLRTSSFASKRVKMEHVSSFTSSINTEVKVIGAIHILKRYYVKPIHSHASQRVKTRRTTVSYTETAHGSNQRFVDASIHKPTSTIRKIKTGLTETNIKNIAPTTAFTATDTNSKRAAKVVRSTSSHSARIQSESSMVYTKLPRISIVSSFVQSVKHQLFAHKEKLIESRTSFVKKIKTNSKARKGYEVSITSSVLPTSSVSILGRNAYPVITTNLLLIHSSAETETAFIANLPAYVQPIESEVVSETRTLKMSLYELKARLEIPQEHTEDDEELLMLLHDSLDYVERTCNQTFDPLPPTVKRVMVEHVKNAFDNRLYVLNESIGGMSQSFESSNDIEDHLYNTLRRAGLLRLHFSTNK